MKQPQFLKPTDINPLHEGYPGPYVITEKDLETIFPGYQDAGLTEELVEFRGGEKMELHFGMMDPKELTTLAGILEVLGPETIFSIDHGLGVELPYLADAAPDARIYTLSIDPKNMDSARFLYDLWNKRYHPGSTKEKEGIITERGLEDRVIPLWQDPGQFDAASFVDEHGRMDVVIVDDNHSYEGTEHDLKNAFRMVREGGLVVVDDWGKSHHLAGVTTAVGNAAREGKVFYAVPGSKYNLAGLALHPNITEARHEPT